MEYALFRLQKKSGDSSDTCNEASGDLAFDSRNHVAAASEVKQNTHAQLQYQLYNQNIPRTDVWLADDFYSR